MMNAPELAFWLKLAAVIQLSIAILNVFLVRLLRWQEPVAGMPLLMREVFHVHCWFISITLALFAILTWQFAGEMVGAGNPVAQWLALGIGVFWAIRTVLQITYYSSSHWRGQKGRTLVHVMLLIVYGGLAGGYLTAGLAAR